MARQTNLKCVLCRRASKPACVPCECVASEARGGGAMARVGLRKVIGVFTSIKKKGNYRFKNMKNIYWEKKRGASRENIKV